MSNETKQEVGALALDLKRVAQGYQSNSAKMSDQFAKDALEIAKRLNKEQLPGYVAKVLEKLPDTLNQPNSYERADDALTYSSILWSSVVWK